MDLQSIAMSDVADFVKVACPICLVVTLLWYLVCQDRFAENGRKLAIWVVTFLCLFSGVLLWSKEIQLREARAMCETTAAAAKEAKAKADTTTDVDSRIAETLAKVEAAIDRPRKVQLVNATPEVIEDSWRKIITRARGAKKDANLSTGVRHLGSGESKVASTVHSSRERGDGIAECTDGEGRAGRGRL